jgi:hypothetical protein
VSNQPISRWQSLVAFISIAKISSFIKVSLILGHYTAYFSAINMVMPVAGAWCGLTGSTVVAAVGFLMRFAVYGSALPLHMLSYHIPGLFGAYYFATRSGFIRLAVPLACMGFFLLHPVGFQAWEYTMYWWIPVIIYALDRKSLWLDALGSTFVVHAVGSVIWIYTTESTVSMWLSLMPIVALERLVFMIGIVAFQRILLWISNNVIIPRTHTA